MNHSQGVERRDALVAVVREDIDLERFRNERWYRIPARVLGHSLAADVFQETRFLALYQTASITTGMPGAIELWGEIESVERCLRRQIIPSEPDHPAAQEEYQLVRFLGIERLERPIVSRRRRRFSFLRTTGSRLLAAEDINDLIPGVEVEEKLWKSLEDLGAERRCYIEAGNSVMEVDISFFDADHSPGLLCREQPDEMPTEADWQPWSILRFSHSRLDADFDACLREIFAVAARVREQREVASLSIRVGSE